MDQQQTDEVSLPSWDASEEQLEGWLMDYDPVEMLADVEMNGGVPEDLTRELHHCFATHRENRQKLAKAVKARGFYVSGSSNAGKGKKGQKGSKGKKGKGSSKGGGKARGGMTLQELKAVTTCGDCEQVGHWRGDPECPKQRRGAHEAGREDDYDPWDADWYDDADYKWDDGTWDEFQENQARAAHTATRPAQVKPTRTPPAPTSLSGRKLEPATSYRSSSATPADENQVKKVARKVEALRKKAKPDASPLSLGAVREELAKDNTSSSFVATEAVKTFIEDARVKSTYSRAPAVASVAEAIRHYDNDTYEEVGSAWTLLAGDKKQKAPDIEALRQPRRNFMTRRVGWTNVETIPDSDDEELMTEQQIHRHVSSLTRRAPTVQDGRRYITIDTACENTVCGSSILDLIVRRFLEDYHIVPKIETESERYCFGPGERITSSTRVSLPIAVQGVAMVVNTSTIEQAPGRAPVPFLAGQDWLLFVKTIIDVGAGTFSMPDIGVTAPLLIDHTGHVVIAIDEFPDGKWPHGLNPKAIGYEGIVFDPYWADSSQPLDVDKIFVNEGPDPLAGREIYASDRFDRFESTKFESTKYHLKTSPNYFYEPNDDDFLSDQNLTRGPCTVKPDYWEFQFDKGMIIRHHCRPRSCLFSPTDDRSGPDPDTLSFDRVTVVKGFKDVVRDVWTPLEAQQELPFVWTGFTVLFLKDVSVQSHSLFQPQPVAGVDIVFPGGSEHVVSAKSLQPHTNKRILQFDLDVTPPIFERAPSKRSDRFTIPPKQFGSRAASQRQLTREHRLRPGLHGQASSEGMAAPDHGHRTSLDAPGQVGRHQSRHQRVQAPVSGPDGLHGGNDAPTAADASDGAAGDDQSSGSDSQGLAIGLSAADPSLPPRGGVSSAPGQCSWEVSGMPGLRAAEESSSFGLHGADQQGEGPRVCLPPRLSSAARRKSNKVRPQAKGGGVLWQLGRLPLAVLATGFGGFHQRCGLEEEGGPQSQEQDQAKAIFAEALLGDSFQGRGRQLGQGDGGQRRGGVRWLDEHAPDPDDWHHLKPGAQRWLKRNMRRALAMSRASRKAVQDKMATSSWPRRTFGYDIIEIFGGASMISLRAGRNWGLKVLQPIDIRYGVDLRQRKWRRWLLRKLDVWNPRLAILEYPCTVWSILQRNCNYRDRPEELAEPQDADRPFLRLCKDVFDSQIRRHGHGLCENPATADSQNEEDIMALRRQHHETTSCLCHLAWQDDMACRCSRGLGSSLPLTSTSPTPSTGSATSAMNTKQLQVPIQHCQQHIHLTWPMPSAGLTWRSTRKRISA